MPIIEIRELLVLQDNNKKTTIALAQILWDGENTIQENRRNGSIDSGNDFDVSKNSGSFSDYKFDVADKIVFLMD